MKVENLDFIESAEFLAKKVNYNLQYVYTGTPELPEKRTKLVEICELAKKYYNYVLFNSKVASKARDYLEGRGFKPETIEHFELGYSPERWDSFSEFAIKRGYNLREIIDSGLSIQSTRDKNEIYDRFRGRIMFPIKDLVGKTIGFGGRIINENQDTLKKAVMRSQSAKYINSPETRIYSKSKNIYGLFNAKNSIVENDQALIVEGYTDVILLHQEGIRNAVASLGTALTTDQIGIIGRFTKNMVLVFDSDIAGVSASLRGMERLKEYDDSLDLYHESNINMRVTILEEGFDPADYVMKRGREKFLERVDKAVNIIDFAINMILSKYNIKNLSEKLQSTDELLNFISTLSSKIVQEECVKKISEKLNLRESLLVEQLQKKAYKKSYKVASFREDKKEEQTTSSLKNIEIEALKILVNGIGDKFKELVDIGQEYFKFDDTKRLYEIINKTFSENQSKDNVINFPLEISSNKLEDEQVKKLYNLIIFNPVNYSDYNLACLEVYNNLKRIYISDRIEEIRKQLKQFENYRKDLIKKNDRESASKLEKVDNKIKELNLKLNELENEKIKYKIFN